MKKIFSLLATLVLLVALTGCSYLDKRQKEKEAAKFNDIRVTFVTTQGEINFFLYPEAAPLTVANFINLAQRGYYDNNKIHRAIENFVVQAGDPTETGQGGPGYTIPDEPAEWLDFYQYGMLAMANAGPGTGGSQYFMTLRPAEWLNGKHTVFGELESDKDFDILRRLEVGDVVKEIRFRGQINFFLSLHKAQIEEWNAILDEKYPDLKKYPIKDPEEFGDQVLQYREELEKLYAPKEVDEDDGKEWPVPRWIRSIEKSLTKDDIGEVGKTEELIDGEATEIDDKEAYEALELKPYSVDGEPTEIEVEDIVE